MADIVYWRDSTLYLNITNQCSNRCYFCFRNFSRGVWGFSLKLDKEPSLNEIINALQGVVNQKHWNEVVFCGFGEPTMRFDCLLEVTRWIKRYHGCLVRLDTNGQGYLLNPKRDVVKELREAGLDSVRVSLNTHNGEVYDEVCKPRMKNVYEPILAFIKNAKSVFDTEVTFVTIPEVDVTKLDGLVKKLGVTLRQRTYEYPVM